MTTQDSVALSTTGQRRKLTAEDVQRAVAASPELAAALARMIYEAELMGLPPVGCDTVKREPNKRTKYGPRGHPLHWDVMVWDEPNARGDVFGHACASKVDLGTAQIIQNTAQVVIELRKVRAAQ